MNGYRHFPRCGCLFLIAILVFSGLDASLCGAESSDVRTLGPGAGEAVSTPMAPLLSKLYACAAAVHIANAMGENVEGKPYGTYEFFDQFPAGRSYSAGFRENTDTYDSIRKAKVREPAMGEDGCERFRWVASSVVRRGRPITIADLAQTLRHDIDPEKFGYLIGWQDQFLYYSLILGLPPEHVGAFASWPGFIGTDKMLGAAVGMMNAGDPVRAAQTARALARLKDVPSGDGNWALDVCAAHAAGLAEAFQPRTTVQRMVDVALNQLSADVRSEVEENLEVARRVGHWRELGPYYAKKYRGQPISRAEEVLSRGLSCFLLAEGDPRRSIIWAANLGRDTDCCCYVAGTLAAAFSGIEAIPPKWVEQVDRQIETCPYANNRRNSWENALGFYRSAQGLSATATIEQLVREHLKMSPDAALTGNDYQRVRSLEGNGRCLKSLEGIQKLANLEWLNLGNNEIRDLTPLAGLTGLEFLDLGGNRIERLDVLAELTDLKELLLDRNQIVDISPLRALQHMRRLNLAQNRIRDLSPLAGMNDLTSLFCEQNQLRSLGPLAGAMPNLIVLNASDNQLDEVGPLGQARSLVGLYLQNNRIRDLEPLGQLTSRIKCLDVSGNRITDLTPLQPLTTLIQLDVGSNRLQAMDAAGDLQHLSYLDLRENRIRNLSPVSGLKHLQVLYVKGNPATGGASLNAVRHQLFLSDF